jgi:nitrogen fixation/metabolism regulation signal transduction histidine kinase
VTVPLSRLHRATEVVGSGSLDFALDLRSDDEIGSLARAFDQMVERLRQTTVSRNELLQANQACKPKWLSARRPRAGCGRSLPA